MRFDKRRHLVALDVTSVIYVLTKPVGMLRMGYCTSDPRFRAGEIQEWFANRASALM
jgi:hypothetical protein